MDILLGFIIGLIWALTAIALLVVIFVDPNIFTFWKKDNKPITIKDWGDLATGKSGDIELEREWLRIAQEIFSIFCKKQHDYGPSNIAMGGVRGVILRTSDKIARLWELTGLKDLVSGRNFSVKSPDVDESLEDTLIDAADYPIIALMVLRGKWPKLDVDDAFGQKALSRLLVELLDDDTFRLLADRLIADEVASLIAEDIGGEVVSG